MTEADESTRIALFKGKEIRKIKLPPEEERIVKEKTDRVRKKVLRPATPPTDANDDEDKDKNDQHDDSSVGGHSVTISL